MKKRTLKLALVAGLLAAATTAATALDLGRLNDAAAALTKATALLAAVGPDKAGHVAKAQADIASALREVQAAESER